MPYLVNTSAPVLVTGASGYVAGWIVKKLLERGATVHGAVRDPKDEAKVGHLRTMAENSPGGLKLFKADLLEPGSYRPAMRGCATVFHTASPFKTDVNDPQADLVDPALEGTRNVLQSVNDTETVSKVVLTSSCAAIYGDAADCADAPGGRLDESVWNTTSSLDYQPYSFSKTVAEREAWRIADAQSRWKMVAVNPSLVIGPATQNAPTSESFSIMQQMGNGTMKAGAPRIGLGVVDVRDLADAHLHAAFDPAAEGRNIISGHETDLVEMAKTLQPTFGSHYPLPTRALPKSLVWLLGPMLGGLRRKFVSRNVNVKWRADNSKATRSLGLTYRPLDVSMNEMFGQMVKVGAFDD
ncbi:NAD-dependent epimerase/dehydratase family protein [Pontivivens insulae]|uniref:NAD-dependent epimerase/dehydratase domain-containing protein n=1 Tax=Pontivivens insulae TaxID=1639689 RepID=A0A2R8AEP2_9RHOB|nr:NAD-dependent epimerase/dehydratase family protein [Pontivivens insulae]RED11958.1 dihydroflavonol-4-reductase [Pontivivens insulae]SPF30714.1 hypothetical protein POI8812_03056 [Pontivivens insulae]